MARVLGAVGTLLALPRLLCLLHLSLLHLKYDLEEVSQGQDKTLRLDGRENTDVENRGVYGSCECMIFNSDVNEINEMAYMYALLYKANK